jgi:hypothetical protein
MSTTSKLSPMGQAALDYAAQGIAVFPLGVRAKEPLIKGGNGFKDVTTDPAQIRAWWTKTPAANIGRALGRPYGALMIEDDPRHDGPASLAKLEARYGPLPDTYTVRSGGGGHHRYFKHPGGYIKSLDNRFGDEYPGVDVKADGGYAVAPPSIHPNGSRYDVVNDAPHAELPTAWLDALLALQEAPAPASQAELAGTTAYDGDGAKWLDWAVERKRDGTSDQWGYKFAQQLLVNRVADPERWLWGYAAVAIYDPADPFTGRDVARWLRSAEHSRIVQNGRPARESAPRKQPPEQPNMPSPAKDAPSPDMAPMGIFGGNGHLWRGMVELETVKPEQVRWLWHGRIPLGKLTVVDGNPDLGKSLVFGADISARVSRGRAMPGEAAGLAEPAGVVILSAEDDLSDTIRPRLDAAGADVSRVLATQSVPRLDAQGQPEEGSFFIPRDLPWLREAIAHKDARYVLIDPLMAYLHPGEVNSYRDQDVRTALAPLARLAAETGAAIVAIRHLNKGTASNPLYRGGGSIGIIGAARSGLLVAEDPEDKDRRILARNKGNLAAPVPALAYRIQVTAAGVPAVEWLGVTEHTAAGLLAEPTGIEERSATDEATTWLADELAAGPQRAGDVQNAAKAAGIGEKALRTARERICVRPPRKVGIGKESYWAWELRPDTPKNSKDAQQGEDAQRRHTPQQGTLDADGHLRNGHKPGPPCLRCGKLKVALPEGGYKLTCECGKPEPTRAGGDAA